MLRRMEAAKWPIMRLATPESLALRVYIRLLPESTRPPFSTECLDSTPGPRSRITCALVPAIPEVVDGCAERFALRPPSQGSWHLQSPLIQAYLGIRCLVVQIRGDRSLIQRKDRFDDSRRDRLRIRCDRTFVLTEPTRTGSVASRLEPKVRAKASASMGSPAGGSCHMSFHISCCCHVQAGTPVAVFDKLYLGVR